MTALFDRNCNLAGWLKDNNIFDIDMNWVAYISNNNGIWSTYSGNWIGVLYGTNIRDTSGKTAFWNPNQRIENSVKPISPIRPIRPITPIRPVRPVKPIRPIKPIAPVGGWSQLTWKKFING